MQVSACHWRVQGRCDGVFGQTGKCTCQNRSFRGISNSVKGTYLMNMLFPAADNSLKIK
jgi:hypothetical protein